MVAASWGSPPAEGALRHTGMIVAKHAATFGSIAAVFAMTDTVMESVQPHSKMNAAVAGCAAGSIIGLRAGSIPQAAAGCGLFGFIQGAGTPAPGPPSLAPSPMPHAQADPSTGPAPQPARRWSATPHPLHPHPPPPHTHTAPHAHRPPPPVAARTRSVPRPRPARPAPRSCMTARAPPSPQLLWASRTISLGRSSRARRQVTWRPRDIEEWRRLLSTVARRICGRLHLPARGAASIARQTASVRASALGTYPAGGAAVAKPVCPIQRTNTHSVAERARQSTEHRPTEHGPTHAEPPGASW